MKIPDHPCLFSSHTLWLCMVGLFRLYVVFPPGFPDIFDAVVFPSSVTSTRQSKRKLATYRPPDLCDRTLQKWLRKSACHADVSNLDTSKIGYVAGRRKNSQHISRYRVKKITHETPTMKRFFALSSGQSGERYETKIQQSTNTTSQSTSWARLLAMLERLGCCGSLSITSCQQPILCVFSHG